MTTPEYPYQPDGERVRLTLVDNLSELSFQESEDGVGRKGVWNRLRHFRKEKEHTLGRLVIADDLGPAASPGEVIIGQEDIVEGEPINLYQLLRDNQGKIIAGAALTATVIAVGTLRVIHSRQDG